MSISHEKRRAKSLEHLEKMLQLSKLSIINELSTKKVISDQAFAFAHLTKEIFNYSKKKMEVSSKFVDKVDMDLEPKLIILVIPSKTLLGANSSVLHRMFKKTYKEGDYVIAIYDDAISYLNEQGINMTLKVYNSTKTIDISSIIFSLFNNQTVKSVHFILHSTRVKKGKPLVILPLENSNIEQGNSMIKPNVKYNFYPNILEILNELFYNYIFSITRVLMLDSDFYRLKQKLIKHENSLNSIGDMQHDIQKIISKDRQAKLTEEIMIILKASNMEEGEDD